MTYLYKACVATRVSIKDSDVMFVYTYVGSQRLYEYFGCYVVQGVKLSKNKVLVTYVESFKS